jgi:mannose-6-phosphate isomerase-like protein (cupin superfamily)
MQIVANAGAYTAPEGAAPNHYVERLRVPDLSVGTYSVPAGGVDDQTPHTEDEIYVVTAGHARIVTDTGTADVGPGDVIFVPAGEQHRFVDIAENLTLLVVFAPAHRSRTASRT